MKKTTLNVDVSLEEKEKIDILRNKHAINISRFVKNAINQKYNELEKNEKDNN